MYMPISEGLKSIRADGLKVFQAHPFRNNMRVTDPGLLDGIEIHNGHYDHNSRNEFAYMWAKHYGLTGISGSDFHEIEDLARGGIICRDDAVSYTHLFGCLSLLLKLLYCLHLFFWYFFLYVPFIIQPFMAIKEKLSLFL